VQRFKNPLLAWLLAALALDATDANGHTAGNTLAEKRDATGGTVKVRYLGQGEQRIGGTDAGLYYYTRDHLGSVRELVDASGNVRARYDYGPWGRREKLEGDLEAEFGFTGHHVHGPTGLHLALYRVYDAKMGRWLSADPIKEDGGWKRGGTPCEDFCCIGLGSPFCRGFSVCSPHAGHLLALPVFHPENRIRQNQG